MRSLMSLVSVVTPLLVVALVSSGCDSWETWSIHAEVSPCAGDDDDGDDDDDGEGEEHGTQYEMGETFDENSNGVHLIAAYDEDKGAFAGTAQNDTADVLCDVRIEVHLNNGKELGPTERQDLDPGQEIEWELLVADAHQGEGEEEGEHDEGDEHE